MLGVGLLHNSWMMLNNRSDFFQIIMARTLLIEKVKSSRMDKEDAVQQRDTEKRKKKRKKNASNKKPKRSDTAKRTTATSDLEEDTQQLRRGASHQGEILNRWAEEDMRKALVEFNEQKNRNDRLPIRQIARAWSVPYATFRRRIMQHAAQQSHKHSSGRPTVLKKDEEEELVGHIRLLAEVGFPCSRKDIKSLAFEYATKKGVRGFSTKKGTAGYCWFKWFMRRHKGIAVKKAENLSIARAMSMNRVQVAQWFDKYKEICTRLGIAEIPSHIWNVDETGCQNIFRADKVIGEVGKPTYSINAMERGETSTVLVCINAIGASPPPMIIHKGKLVGNQWRNGARHDVMVRASESGYINKELFTDFGKSFIKFLATSGLKDGLPHLLVLDCHYSHLYNIDFLQLMKENNIHVFALPPHCSHWLQPLDRGVFRSFKQGWQDAMKSHTRNTAGRKLDKNEFFRVFNQAWDYGITVQNAQGGFRGSGLFPINLDAIPDSAYDPSSVTERAFAVSGSPCLPSTPTGDDATVEPNTSLPCTSTSGDTASIGMTILPLTGLRTSTSDVPDIEHSPGNESNLTLVQEINEETITVGF